MCRCVKQSHVSNKNAHTKLFQDTNWRLMMYWTSCMCVPKTKLQNLWKKKNPIFFQNYDALENRNVCLCMVTMLKGSFGLRTVQTSVLSAITPFSVIWSLIEFLRHKRYYLLNPLHISINIVLYMVHMLSIMKCHFIFTCRRTIEKSEFSVWKFLVQKGFKLFAKSQAN